MENILKAEGTSSVLDGISYSHTPEAVVSLQHGTSIFEAI